MKIQGMRSQLSLIPALAAVILLFCFSLSNAASPSVFRVSDIRHESVPGGSRVVVLLDGIPEFKVRTLGEPDRIFVDIDGTGLEEWGGKAIAVDDLLVRRIRTSQFTPTTARIVLDMKLKAEYNVIRAENPPRLIIEVKGSGVTAPKPAVSVIPPERVMRSVVIDPGHGGHDPGAVGPDGLMEKDVVLQIAKELKKSLEASGDYSIYLTRSTDVYLTLEQRTAIANKKGADLFVSVHVNADKAHRGRGFETYLLNWTDDEGSMKVAARENSISLTRMKQARNDVEMILASLELQYKRDESLMLAHLVQDAMVDSVVRDYDEIINLGVKQAFFYVLFGARMPSILVEASFISHDVESRRLASPRYREMIAEGIAEGIDAFFAESSPVQNMAKR